MSSAGRSPHWRPISGLGSATRDSLDRSDGSCDLDRVLVRTLSGADQMVGHLANLMRAGEFRANRKDQEGTVAELSRKWGVKYERVAELAKDAARMVRLEVADPDRLAIKGFQALERIADEALEGTDDDGNLKSRRLALSAYGDLLTMSGAVAPTKTVVATVDLTTLTDEQIQVRRQAIMARQALRDAARTVDVQPVPNGADH